MKNTHKIVLVLFVGSLISCATLNESVNPYGIQLDTGNLSALNGVYKRSSICDTIGVSHYCLNNLFYSFFIFPSRYLWDSNCERDLVELEVVDNERIKVIVWTDGKIDKEKILKGKIVNNEFEFNRRIFLVPLVFMNYYEDRKARVGLFQNGNLSVDIVNGASGNFFIFPWSGGGIYDDNLEFERVYDY